jgi:hypothetical protein
MGDKVKSNATNAANASDHDRRKQARLAEKLRENLARRKAQARLRQAAPADDDMEPGETAGAETPEPRR